MYYENFLSFEFYVFFILKKKNKLWEEIFGIIKFIMKDVCYNLVNLFLLVILLKYCIWFVVIFCKIS